MNIARKDDGSQFPVGFLGCYAWEVQEAGLERKISALVSIPCRVSRLLRLIGEESYSILHAAESQFPVGFLGCYAFFEKSLALGQLLAVSIPCRVSRLLRLRYNRAVNSDIA